MTEGAGRPWPPRARRRQMVDAFGLQAVTELALGKNPGVASQVATGITGKGLMLANSREDETEADEYGARYASGAGYDPHGLITFFQKLEKQEGHSPQFMKFLSDHPANESRVNTLEEHFRKNPSIFSHFNPDRASANPFSVPEDAPISFLR